MTQQTCETCHWWDNKPRSDRKRGVAGHAKSPPFGVLWGLCRVSAPTTADEQWAWPIVGPDDWCRQHEPKSSASA